MINASGVLVNTHGHQTREDGCLAEGWQERKKEVKESEGR